MKNELDGSIEEELEEAIEDEPKEVIDYTSIGMSC